VLHPDKKGGGGGGENMCLPENGEENLYGGSSSLRKRIERAPGLHQEKGLNKREVLGESRLPILKAAGKTIRPDDSGQKRPVVAGDIGSRVLGAKVRYGGREGEKNDAFKFDEGKNRGFNGRGGGLLGRKLKKRVFGQKTREVHRASIERFLKKKAWRTAAICEEGRIALTRKVKLEWYINTWESYR